MSAVPRYCQRLATLRSVFAGLADRYGDSVNLGSVGAPCTESEIAELNEHCGRFLGCSLPGCYAAVLREFNGMGTQGTVLYGTDEPTDKDAGTWPRQGIIYATLTHTWFTDPTEPFKSPWLVIGENELARFVISRDGKRFCVFHGPFSHSPTEELVSLDALLCYAMDIMVSSNRPSIVE